MRRVFTKQTLMITVLAALVAGPAVAQDDGRPRVRLQGGAENPQAAPVPQGAPRILVRLVTEEQAHLPVGAFAAPGDAARAGHADDPVVIRIDSGSPVGTAGEPPAAIAAYRPGEQQTQPTGSGGDSLFDALVSPSWSGGGGFDRMAWPEPQEAEQQQVQQQQVQQQQVQQAVQQQPMPTSIQGAPQAPPATASLSTDMAGALGTAGNVSTPGSLAAVAGEGYRLGPGDQIDVFVWRNPDLSRQVPVRPDGRITMPLVGEVVATGKTVQQLQDELTSRLGEYVQMPTVTVSVSAVRSLVVYVLGNVRTPGPVQMDRNLTVLQAVAMAGGVNEFADRNDIVVMRTDAHGVHQRWSFRYDDVVEGKGLSTNVVLQSGDVIYVP